MSRGLVLPNFPTPPSEYDQKYQAEVVRAFSVFLQQVNNPGPWRSTSITITNLQANSTGLEDGTLFQVNGYVKVAGASEGSAPVSTGVVQLEGSELFKVTAAQVTAGEIELQYSVASGSNVRINQPGGLPLINASVNEAFFSGGNFAPDKPDFRIADASNVITIRASDLSTNIAENDVIEVRYDINSTLLSNIRQVISQEPEAELITITATDISRGYFLLSDNPSNPDMVQMLSLGGVDQLNRSSFTTAELALLPDNPDFQVASPTASDPKAVYIRSMDFSSLSDENLTNKLSDNIVEGDDLVVYYRS